MSTAIKASFPRCPVTIVYIGGSSSMVAATVEHSKHSEIDVLAPYAQYEKVISVSTRTTSRSRPSVCLVTPSDAQPPLCIVLRGTQQIALQDSGVVQYGLTYRPEEWQHVHGWALRITEQLASRFEVLFDWRDHFKETGATK